MHLKINSIGADRAKREILERLGMDGGCEGVEQMCIRDSR